MPYQLYEQWSSPNFDTPEQMPYIMDGQPRIVESGTIHHWDDPANHPTFEGTVATLCNPAAGRSAHNIIQDGRVACIVSNVNCAWHAGNWHGNATSIGYECSPYMTDGDYETIGEKIADDWKAFGVFPLVPHSSWTATSCPGGYDLERIRTTAERYYNGNTPTTAPPTDWFTMATQQDLIDAITHPDVLDAIALAVLHRECTLIDPSGETGNVVEGQVTTLAKKINWAAHNDAQILTAITRLTPTSTPATTAPAPATGA